MKYKLTGWFPKGSRPVRKGVYRIETGFGIRYSYWDKGFHYFCPTVKLADSFKDKCNHGNMFKWRGIVK